MDEPLTSSIYVLKVNKRKTRTKYEICSKLTLKTPERHYWRRSGVFIVNAERISLLLLLLLLSTRYFNKLGLAFPKVTN